LPTNALFASIFEEMIVAINAKRHEFEIIAVKMFFVNVGFAMLQSIELL
jgi:hypothetical protein